MEKVTILITTYNLEKFIAEALDSILKQKTNFGYKIIIGDDASNDKTVDILREYKKEYPDIIQLVLRNQNIGSLRNSIELYEKCDTEYFSFLDGDDFWLTEDRLQRQVDFMDRHPEYTICGANTQYKYEDKLRGKKNVIPKNKLGQDYSIDDYYLQKVPFVHTSSILFRNVIFKERVPNIYYSAQGTFEECALRGEDFRFLLHLSNGKMRIMNDCLSVYRIHSKGIWQGKSNIQRNMESAIYYNFCRKYLKGHSSFFENLLQVAYERLMKNLIKEKKIIPKYDLNTIEHSQFVGLIKDICENKE